MFPIKLQRFNLIYRQSFDHQMSTNHRIIQIIAIAHIILGIALPFLGKIDFIGNLLVEEIFSGIELSETAHTQAAYIISLFGPTVASWGILLLVLENSFYAEPTKEKWLGLFAAVLVWYIGDTSYSLMHGVQAALILNSVVAISLLIPIWLNRNILKGKRNQ